MGKKNTVIFLVAIMTFFATLIINNHTVVASRNIAMTNYISIYNKSNNYGISKGISVAEHGELELERLLKFKKSKREENFGKQAQLDNLKNEIKVFLGDNINKVGLVYYDLNCKKFIEINGDKQFLAASTIKVPINMLMYDMIKAKKIDINEKLIYNEGDFEEGAGILQGTDLNKPLPLKTLSDYSIIYSDNIAINMILRKVGNENKYNYIEKIVGHAIAHSENNTTPMDSFKILEKLYLNLEHNEYYSDMLETMKKTEYHDRIDKYIPKEIVAHKIGDFAECVNDMAIVCKENPYILVVFTDNLTDANEIIAKISKLVYESQE